VTVSAAASTKEIIEELAARFERQMGGTVHVNLGGSNALAAQIIQGAPADLFLSASSEWATAVADAGLVARQAPLVANTLVIVTPKGNPAGIREPGDVAREAVRHIALAGETVPAGRYADQALESLKLLESLTEERKIVRGQDVRVALSYVERGEAEAGIVYATDARANKNVEVVYTFDSSAHDPIEYILVTLKHAEENPMAARFAEFLQSDEAEATFELHGFRQVNR
jgi:molybdate transport system substrate-binding protein